MHTSIPGVVAVTLLSLGLISCGRSEPGTLALTPNLPANALQIKVLSNRADLISGGDALVEVVTANGTKVEGLSAKVGERDVSALIAARENGRVMGLITDLPQGASMLTVKLPGGVSASIPITNYPNGGPIFSGPQIQPWPCLAGALDAQCNRNVTYAYFYMPALAPAFPCAGTAGCSTPNFQAYNPKSPPPAGFVATTTTDQGNKVPYIVRVETGAQDRGQYAIAVLFDPAKDWQPWAQQPGWNGKTFVTGGSGCGTHHGETTAPGVLDDYALSRGYMVWSTALDHNTQNCNLVVQAESLMMAKERITEVYGPIRFTIGSGCSGGSIYQQQAANDYPGIFDGILPNCSFPDSWTTAVEVVDCRLLVDYFDDPRKWAPGVVWPAAQQALVEGHPGPNICESWINVYSFDQGGNPRAVTGGLGLQSCNVPAGSGPDKAYDPQTNPGGVRCDLTTYFANQLGKRPDGLTNRPSDNVGVQYGLEALQAGQITAAQFVDLNQKAGGRDMDYNPIPERVEADAPAIGIAYRGGLYNMGNNMHLPIIDLRGHDIAEIHHDYRSYVMRARLDRSNGHHDNQVIWVGPLPLVGDTRFPADALAAMDEWLTAIEADVTDLPYEQKVVKNKPAAAHDRCTDANGDDIPNADVCSRANMYYREPRMVAGEPFTGDVLKCQLKPLDRADYAAAIPVAALTDAQFAQLQDIFKTGVCDYSKPGVDQQMTIPWMTYANGAGGKALGPAPVSVSN